jgi:hypothetical protein
MHLVLDDVHCSSRQVEMHSTSSFQVYCSDEGIRDTIEKVLKGNRE